MDFAKVTVEVRKQSGKGSARKARAAGKVPGILYGHKEAPVCVTVDPRLLLKSLDKDKRRNTVFSLHVTADGQSSDVTAMIRDVQIHPISRTIVHVDFIRVSMDEEVKVTVPVVLIGTPVGVVNGGNLHQSMHAVPVAAKPAAIPSRLEIDVSGLNIGDALHVSDLKLPEGVRPLLDQKEGIASVVAPRAEKVEEGAAAAPAAAEGAPAAAPAEGAADKAAAAPAAKKEGGGEKKAK